MERIDGYVFTEIEFLCMASLVGMKKIYGYDYNKSEHIKKDVHYALYGLAKKKYICMDKHTEAIHGSREIKEIFNIIQKMQHIYEVVNTSTNERLIIYKGEDNKSVYIRQSSTRTEEVIIGIIFSDYIAEFLLDEGYIKYVINNDLYEGENDVRYGNFRNDTKEDKLLCIKKINKEYNIELAKIIDIYESYILDVERNEMMKLTLNNVQKVFI